MIVVVIVVVVIVVVVIVVVVIVVVIVVVVIVVVVHVPCLAELDGAHGGDGLVDDRAVGLRRLDHVDETLLECCAVRDQDGSVADLGNLTCRRLKVMGVGTDRHDRHDVDVVADHLLDDVAQDVGGDDHRRPVDLATSRDSGVIPIVSATGGCQQRQGSHQRNHRPERGHHQEFSNSENEYRIHSR